MTVLSNKHTGKPVIKIQGACQHNLKNLNLTINHDEITVFTGVSGSGKSSLVFDTLYAEGQRRYFETFSPYARQFLDRMDKPKVDRIDGILPAVAIEQVNPVRTSRSTVGTMTEINDYLKVLFANLATPYCGQCGNPVYEDTVSSIALKIQAICQANPETRLAITFPIQVPVTAKQEEIEHFLSAQGYTRILKQAKKDGQCVLDVIQDRFRGNSVDYTRLTDAIASAVNRGKGKVNVYTLKVSDLKQADQDWSFSTGLHCANCDRDIQKPVPNHFSFNSPLGACLACHGFGRTIDIDYNLVIPDDKKTIVQGCVKPWQTPSFKSCQEDLMRFCKLRGVATDIPFRDLPEADQHWIIEGDPQFSGNWNNRYYYGVAEFFKWLESKSYKMHIRVMLSKYRAYNDCSVCHGTRFKQEVNLWRIQGKTMVDLMQMPLSDGQQFFQQLQLPLKTQNDHKTVLQDLHQRYQFLNNVGLGYLTLGRQSRTLSGGEVQRINLTTALGSSLVNTLFVLDEPSIGLHPRDIVRIARAIRQLREAGNTVVLVEHDPQLMILADRIVDLGPGPGKAGGEIVFDGPSCHLKNANTLTAEYLMGRKHAHWQAQTLGDFKHQLKLTAISANNLKHIDFTMPLNRLVVLTGVSGSGKSTLVQSVLVPALKKYFGQATEQPGPFGELEGADQLSDILFVDQSPLGKTTRSNPASYVGAFEEFRKLFSQQPLAKQRGYKPGFFSFNSGDGRCSVCLGNGFEHLEMQFLSDVYLTCSQCQGSRYRPDALEVTVTCHDQTYNLAQVLELTVQSACDLFVGNKALQKKLHPLLQVGLGYLTLGQPVPTLSGGEAQRLKLAGYLAKLPTRVSLSGQPISQKGCLFVFDEPTTGLHFEDVTNLLKSLRLLQQAGHSVLIIEHNLDAIVASDWLIDLGPEAGQAGGNLVAQGTPKDVAYNGQGHTAWAIKHYLDANSVLEFCQTYQATEHGQATNYQLTNQQLEDGFATYQTLMATSFKAKKIASIQVKGAREHNLKNVSVNIPHGKMTVVTGPSGSGKSTLAFDVLFSEGQRRYLESLNAYARQFVQPANRPEVDAIYGIPPTVAIEQRTSRGGHKSTVATLTEIYHYLRLIFVKLGTPHCPKCQVAIAPQSQQAIVSHLLKNYNQQEIAILVPLVQGRKGVYNEMGAWLEKNHYDLVRIDGHFVPSQPWPKLERYQAHFIELPLATLNVQAENNLEIKHSVEQALNLGQGSFMVTTLPLPATTPLQAKTKTGKPELPVTAPQPLNLNYYSTKQACPSCATSYPELDPRLFSFNSKHGWCPRCYGVGQCVAGLDADDMGEEGRWLDKPTEAETGLNQPELCSGCEGKRLNALALAVTFHQNNIAQLTRLTPVELLVWLKQLKLNAREAAVLKDIQTEIQNRLAFLDQIGLGYLTLDRAAPTLSGGEAQRIRLASQLGTTLQGVCYVLDEPSIGLHARDTQKLIDALKTLVQNNNTLVVVEHDFDTISQADEVLDMGPAAGSEGGQITSQGSLEDIANNPNSLTGRYLKNPIAWLSTPNRAVKPGELALQIQGAYLHNLKQLDARIPLSRLVAVTGVSGSGKSTLIRNVLLTNIRMLVAKQKAKQTSANSWFGCQQLNGFESIKRVQEVDQTPIGKTARSCPATYVGFWEKIRRLLADTEAARIQGFQANRFSFNTGPGRCSTCDGLGLQTIEMNFLPDVKVQCEMCLGQRFNPQTLQVTWRDHSVADILNLTVEKAEQFFQAHASIAHPLRLLNEVGLGYLTIGQPSHTLSGGEAQRIKLVAELAKVRHVKQTPHTLYVLDEPTVGLHMNDVEKLIAVLHRLVDANHTVLVIEHDLDVIAQADWVLDLGPEAGEEGGRIINQGTPQQIACGQGHTAKAMQNLYARGK